MGERLMPIGMKSTSRRDWTEAHRKCEEERVCRVCGAPASDAAHIIPRSLGGGMSAAAVVPLCREDHTAYDDHDLDLLPYLTREEELEAVRVVGISRAYRILGGMAA